MRKKVFLRWNKKHFSSFLKGFNWSNKANFSASWKSDFKVMHPVNFPSKSIFLFISVIVLLILFFFCSVYYFSIFCFYSILEFSHKSEICICKPERTWPQSLLFEQQQHISHTCISHTVVKASVFFRVYEGVEKSKETLVFSFNIVMLLKV